jgi:hypothetical protein
VEIGGDSAWIPRLRLLLLGAALALLAAAARAQWPKAWSSDKSAS